MSLVSGPHWELFSGLRLPLCSFVSELIVKIQLSPIKKNPKSYPFMSDYAFWFKDNCLQMTVKNLLSLHFFLSNNKSPGSYSLCYSKLKNVPLSHLPIADLGSWLNAPRLGAACEPPTNMEVINSLIFALLAFVSVAAWVWYSSFETSPMNILRLPHWSSTDSDVFVWFPSLQEHVFNEVSFGES